MITKKEFEKARLHLAIVKNNQIKLDHLIKTKEFLIKYFKYNIDIGIELECGVYSEGIRTINRQDFEDSVGYINDIDNYNRIYFEGVMRLIDECILESKRLINKYKLPE